MFIFDEFLIYFEDALARNDRCDFVGALASWDEALRIRESPRARWNRGQALLSLGRYPEGFADYAIRWQLFPDMINPGCEAIRERLPLWLGEEIRGKRLVLLGEAGLGDVVMLARYIPVLQALGAEVVLAVPEPLRRLLAPLAPIGDDGDLCCPFFDVMLHLCQTVESIPGAPYLKIDPALRRKWHHWLPEVPFGNALSIGIAWAWREDVGHDRDFKRAIPLDEFITLLDAPAATLYSLQPNDRLHAEELGVIVPNYADFADVAAVTSLMDVVVSADVAAVHVAGAIGHPNTYVMLPWLASWRWLGGHVWYPRIKRCQQTMPGSWDSAFAGMPTMSSQYAQSANLCYKAG